MAVLSLPLTFANSFWSQDYRKGLQVLYGKLEQGVAENDEIVAFLRARAQAESNLANALINPLPINKSNNGFGADDGASLLMAFRGLQAESAAQGQAHNAISKELSTLVTDPFDDWARAYKDRIKQNKATVIDNWLRSYEQAQVDVAKLKSTYLAKVRRADEAEDDAKFAPNSAGPVDKFTSSPRMRPVDGRRTPPQRTASVSERIAQRLKEIQKKSALALSSATASEDVGASPESISDAPLPSVDKGKGKERDFGADDDRVPVGSPPPLSPLPPPKDLPPFQQQHTQPILLAGLAIPPASLSVLLTRAAAELPLRAVRFPLLGEYQDAFTGEEFVGWLQENVPGLGGSIDRAEEAAKDLTQRDGLLRRLGELGNLFEDADDAWYQFRAKAFELGKPTAETTSAPALNQENILKKTNNFVSLVSKAINNTTTSLSSNPNEPAYIRARHEADEADRAYRIGVRRLDRHRLALEERVEEALKILQRWEGERLRAVKTVLLQYQGTLANLPKLLDTSIERQSTLITSFQPESDLTALIERYRTGPFRPSAHVYESVAHDEVDVVFGVDLRWDEGWWSGGDVSMNSITSGNGSEGGDRKIPPVLNVMLRALEMAYADKETSDVEKRKSWIYEVPLGGVHQLRESLNAVAGQALQQSDDGEGQGQSQIQVGKYKFSEEDVGKWGMPVVAACVKLWMLEMNPPIGMWEGWEEFRKLYPTVGGRALVNSSTEGADAAEGEGSGSVSGKDDEEEARLGRVAGALLRLPRVHLLVLDAVVKHLRGLVERTRESVEESEEVFYTKVALSMGRTILRPKVETELSIQDRHPTLLLIDLLKHYDTLLPPTIARKKRESERKMPIRKRTAPIDIRLSRSRISVGADVGQLLAAQQVAQNPSLKTTMGHARSGSAMGGNTASVPSPPPPVSAGVVASPLPVSSDAYSTSVPAVPPPPPPAVTRVSPAPPVVPPPPPPVLEKVATPPPPPPPAPAAVAAPAAAVLPTPPPPPPLDAGLQRPSFKEPPPEFDNLPPRPSFKEPPPEIDDLPPRPAFADPPPEDDSTSRSGRASVSSSPLPSPPPPPPVLATNVIPPTPQKRGSLAGGNGTGSGVSSRSASPAHAQHAVVVDGDVVLGTGRTSITRSGSSQAQQAGAGVGVGVGAGVTRGPRLARATRGGGSAGGGSVQSLVQNLNRSSMSGGTPVSPGSPKVGARLSGSPVRRPSSVVGRSGASFSRRTMASDAEDDVVERK